MRGSFIILSDIAASTLAIALFIFLVAFAFQGKNQAVAEKVDLSGEIATTFKTFTAPPLSSSEIVNALFNRTLGGDVGANSLDIFEDRIVLTTRTETNGLQRREIARLSVDFLQELKTIGDDLAGADGPIYLFVFSNDLFNVSHAILTAKNLEVVPVSVPAGLQVTSERTGRRWSPAFTALTQQNLDKPAFRNALKKILSRRNTSETLSSLVDNPSLVHGKQTTSPSHLPLSERLLAWLKWAGTVLLVLTSTLSIVIVERCTAVRFAGKEY